MIVETVGGRIVCVCANKTVCSGGSLRQREKSDILFACVHVCSERKIVFVIFFLVFSSVDLDT